MDLYSIGEMVIDFIPGEEKHSYLRKAGGAPGNVAISVAKNGLDAGMCCSVGDDDFGRFLQETLVENGVQLLKPDLCEQAITTMAFVSLDASGDRSFTFARKPGADMFIAESDVCESDIANTRIVHAGSFSLSASPAKEATIKALKLGHDLGKLVSFDINYRDIAWKGQAEACRTAFQACLPYIDLLKISDEEEGFLDLSGEDIPSFMDRVGLTVLVKTLGPEGAVAYYQGKEIRVQGKDVNVVDTTGAGDAFWGGFLSYLCFNQVRQAEDLSAGMVEDALNYANISGSICVQKKGAIAALPTRSEIEQYMQV